MKSKIQKALLLFIGIVLSVNVNAQTEQMTYVNAEWVNQSPAVGTGVYYSSSIVVSNQLIVATKVLNGSGDTDIATIKYTVNGDTLWMKTFAGSAGSDDYGIDIATTASGDIVVIGTSQNSGTAHDYTIIRYSSLTGTLQWSYTWNGIANGVDIPTDLVIDPSDNIYVTGGSADGLELSDYATIKLSGTGVLQWTSLYDYNDLQPLLLYNTRVQV